MIVIKMWVDVIFFHIPNPKIGIINNQLISLNQLFPRWLRKHLQSLKSISFKTRKEIAQQF